MVRGIGMRRSTSAQRSGFTLIELLMVLAIMSILIGGLVLSMRGINDSGKFDQSLNNVTGILERSRAYASAQDTYVWVVFYQNTPATGPLDVFVGSFASNDGTDPLNWSGSVTLPSPGTVGGTTLLAVTPFYHLKGLHLETTTLPSAPTSPSLPADNKSAPNFQCTAPSDAGPVTLSNANSTYWVIQFAPNGMARNSANPISSIWFGLQPAYSQTVFDPHNIASIKVNGLTGQSTIYRQ